MVKIILASGFLLSAALLSSCQRKALHPSPGSESDSAASEPDAAASTSTAAISPASSATTAAASSAATTVPFTLSLSSGGGFTGRYSGFTLSSDGTVKQWERSGGADSVVWESRIPPDRIIGFKTRLEQGGALGIGLRETGNMTTRVDLRLPDTLYVWSWSGADAAETAPEPFRSWYPEVRGFCAALQSTDPKAQSRPDGK